MRIKFLGAAGEVTGSCYLLTSTSGESILIDCGMFQGSDQLERLNYVPLDCDCSKISAVVLTHAHLDHCGRLPILLPAGFNKSIFMTPATREITEISLFDSAHVGKNDHGKNALYTRDQAQSTVALFRTVEYENNFNVGPFSIVYRDAGHILGSASIEITDKSSQDGMAKIVFSGDLGNTPEDLIKATEQIVQSDIVVMESTYGDSNHPEEKPIDIIKSEINEIEASGGVLLIPAFSIERSQEILHLISHLKKDGQIKPETPVYFDSPMAEKVTKIFEKYPQYLNSEFSGDFSDGDPFMFKGLVDLNDQGKIKSPVIDSGPRVIIAGSGMMTGGRIMRYGIRYLPLPTTRLLIVGYQAEDTPGRAILEGQKSINIEGVEVTIRASVNQSQALSSHADQPKLMHWVSNIGGVKTIFLSHGENGPRGELAEKIKAETKIQNVFLPNFNQEFDLSI